MINTFASEETKARLERCLGWWVARTSGGAWPPRSERGDIRQDGPLARELEALGLLERVSWSAPMYRPTARGLEALGLVKLAGRERHR